VWLLAQESKARPLRIDLFPRALTAESLAAAADSPAVGLWRELAPAYAQFEATHVPPRFKIDGKTGAYVIAPAK
jgi:murein L,D-transpeptidase YafK